MSKKAFVCALSLALGSPAAFSAVTLYGILDEGPTFVSNVAGNKQWSLDSGVIQQSRYGFTGTEDLGGGYSAFFRLEQGFSISNGALATAGDGFSREARVALSAPWGTLSLGRQPTASIDALFSYTAAMLGYGPSYLSTHPGDLDRTLNIPIDSSVKYTSPTYAGVTLIGLYGVGGQPGSLQIDSTRNVALTFARGPVSLGASYLRIFGVNVTNSVLFGATSNPLGPTGPHDSLQSIGFGGSYQFDNVLVHGVVTQSRFDQSRSQARSYESGVKYNLSPAFVIGADYDFTLVDGRAHMNLGTLSMDYFLSKATDLYAVTAYEWVAGRNSVGGELTAQMFTLASASGSRQLAVHMGLRHRF